MSSKDQVVAVSSGTTTATLPQSPPTQQPTSTSVDQSGGSGPSGFADSSIETWKLKKLIKSLAEARGNGTSMITLIMPPKSQVSYFSAMLTNEYGTASNIKSRVNRQSVLDAIISTQQKLKLYTRIPPNGLCIFCGTVLTEEGKERMVNIDIEPFRPINTTLYMCDNKFHIKALAELLESDLKFGFIVMDGNGTLFGTVSGSTREVLQKITVDLPKKHGRGGQSAVRFGRLRMEKRHNYLRKVAEISTQLFITSDRPNVHGLILAGSAEFKNELRQSDLFDQRLACKVLKVVDVSYGGEPGFNQAIDLCSDALDNVKLVQEKKLIGKFFEEISIDSRKYCFGVEDSLRALDLGAVETLIVWENLPLIRVSLNHPTSGESKVLILTPEQMEDKAQFQINTGNGGGDPFTSTADDYITGGDTTGSTGGGSSSLEYRIVEKIPFVEWLATEYRSFGCSLEFVTDRSQEGSQFVKGFGGLGGILRYPVDMAEIAAFEEGSYDPDY